MAAFLIVDEDHNFRDALAIGLRLDGHHAVALADPDEARVHLETLSFDCCVVDAHLPGADALLETAAASGAHAIAMGPYPELLSAAARRHPRAAALPKPFRASELVARLARASAA
jgi:DNA-binding NtrC family response regulator